MENKSVSLDEFHKKICSPVLETRGEIRILDLGCGKGLEIKHIFQKAPNTHLTGIDTSAKMLSELKGKYKKALKQLLLIKGSYERISFEEKEYDYVISIASLHHLLYTPRLKLYRKVIKALKKDGKFIEGHYFDEDKNDKQIDIPFSIKKQKKLMLEAGFMKARAIWNKKEAAIIVAS